MITISPKLTHEIPRSDQHSIALIGASGRVGRAVISALIQRLPDIPVQLFAKDEYTALRLRLYLTDLGNPSNIIVITARAELAQATLLIICTGLTTEKILGPNKKSRLLEANKKIVLSELEGLSPKVALLATNPTTQLSRCLTKCLGYPVLGMGVHNDQIRYEKLCGDEGYRLVGAHNLSELIIGVLPSFPLPQKSMVCSQTHYTELSIKIDQAVEFHKDYLRNILEGEPKETRWWIAQNLNTKLNASVYSCSVAIANCTAFLLGRYIDVTLELPLGFESSDRAPFSAHIGWPINAKSGTPERLTFANDASGPLNNLITHYGIL